MTEIVLEDCYDEKGKFMGRISIPIADLTPEFLDKIKKDRKDKMGWKKYHDVLRENGYLE